MSKFLPEYSEIAYKVNSALVQLCFFTHLVDNTCYSCTYDSPLKFYHPKKNRQNFATEDDHRERRLDEDV